MHRRSFLYNSGILVPAVLIAPSSAWASSAAIQTPAILVTQDNRGNMADIMQEAADSFIQVPASDITEISYYKDGFGIITSGGKKYIAAKLVLDSDFSVNGEQSVKIHTGIGQQLYYNSGKNKNKVRPEFWTFNAEKLKKDQLVSFLKRKRHAFMCVS